MHYYKRNIGDYAKKAGRLTMLQHGAYTLLIDSCYDREVFPTLDQAIEWTWASTEAEVEAVKFVLSRFFTLNKDGQYVQDRILEELLHYHAKADTNKRIADEREAKRKVNGTKGKRNVNESSKDVNEPLPNHKPITTKQEPSEKRGSKKCPKDFTVTDDMMSWARAECPLVNAAEQTEVFRDYEFSAARSDWLGTWRNWMRKANKYAAEKSPYQKTSSGIIAGAI
jgi:uncharacterized protein YdaU (DUF1376 family)